MEPTKADEWSALFSGISASVAISAFIAATVISILSWLAALRATEAAETMSRLEKDRQHRDARPQIDITCTPVLATGGAYLELMLTGPQGVEEVHVSLLQIQDSQPWANPVVAGPSREELAMHVRGPYEFQEKLDGQRNGGRTVEPFTLVVGYPHKLVLKTTHAPLNSGIPEKTWEQDVNGMKLRLALECTQDGFDEPWRYVHPQSRRASRRLCSRKGQYQRRFAKDEEPWRDRNRRPDPARLPRSSQLITLEGLQHRPLSMVGGPLLVGSLTRGGRCR